MSASFLGTTMMINDERIPKDASMLRYSHVNRPRNNIVAFQGLPDFHSLRCLEITDYYKVIDNLRGIEFPSSLRCLSMSISYLDASLLPRQLTSLTIDNSSHRFELTIVNEFPSSLRSLKITNARLMTGLDQFRSDSMLEMLVLKYVSVFPGTTLAHLPRRVVTVNLEMLYEGPLHVVDCPPNLRDFKAVLCDGVIHETMELPSMLRDVEINARRLDRIPASVQTLLLEFNKGENIPEIAELPPNLRTLALQYDTPLRGVPPPFIVVRTGAVNKIMLRDKVRIFSNLHGPPDWYQIILSDLVHYRPPFCYCDLCFNYTRHYFYIIHQKFGVLLNPRCVWAEQLLTRASFMLFVLDQRRSPVDQLPTDIISLIASFLFV